jgi:hypothetical protein
MLQHDEEDDHDDEDDFDNFEHDDDHIPALIPQRLKLKEATMFQQAFEERNAKVLFKQNHSKKIELDLKNVILLDSQSTMDLFWNPKLVDKTYKTDKKMRLKSNGGTMITAFCQPFAPCPHLRLRCVREPLTAHLINGHRLLHFLLSRMSQPLMGCADKFMCLSAADAQHVLCVQKSLCPTTHPCYSFNLSQFTIL